MEFLDGLIKAFQLILSGNQKLIEMTLRSLFVSGSATVVATLWGIPIAMFLGLKNFHGRTLVKTVFTTLIGMPTVALGFFLFLIFSRENGPLGFLGLLYTPTAIIIGEAILVTPIVVSLAATAIEAVDPEIMSLARTLGASEAQAAFAVLKEASNGIFLAGVASFNRAIGELGVAMFVGGFIAGSTELLTTGIKVELDKNNIDIAIGLAIILLALVFGITIAINIIQRRKE